MVKVLMAAKRQILLLSSSNVHGHCYLQHAKSGIASFLEKNNVKNVLFVPYASTDHDAYLEKVAPALAYYGVETVGLHKFDNPSDGIGAAECIFVGGGNTFLLLNTLYSKGLVELIQKKVLKYGVPYMGSSAGTNVATISINTTNDMPIVHPPSFKALGLVPFNINPHYIEPEPNSKHKGETRAERIAEYHKVNGTPVLGLPEGTSVLVDGEEATLIGDTSAKLFQKDEAPKVIEPDSDLSYLLQYTEVQPKKTEPTAEPAEKKKK